MKQTEIIIIAALAGTKRVIGKDGKLPWPPIPKDIERFKELTIGHAVIMGRKTWELDLEQGYLPDRYNVVISSTFKSQEFPYSQNLTLVDSLQSAFVAVKDFEKAYIVGGAGIYSQSLKMADKWELTLIDGEYQGDTFFPEYEFLIGDSFTMTNLEQHPGFGFATYDRIVH